MNIERSVAPPVLYKDFSLQCAGIPSFEDPGHRLQFLAGMKCFGNWKKPEDGKRMVDRALSQVSKVAYGHTVC